MSYVAKLLWVVLLCVFLTSCTRDRVTGEFILTADPVALETLASPRESGEDTESEVREPIVYIVREGDILSAVAERFETTIADIKSLNPQLTSDRLFPGDELRVPAPPNMAAGTTTEDLDEAPVYYTVQAGDMVSAIALEFGVTLDEIQAANPLVDLDQVPEGVRLVIPVPASSLDWEEDGLYHTVQAGDTVNDIALRYGVEADAIQKINNLESQDTIAIGQRLRLPEDALISGMAQPEPQITEVVTHTVRAGETLSEIALYYEVTTRSIIEANGLQDQDQIAIGQSLLIPGVAPQVQDGYLNHTVRAGETLTAIAQQYDVSIDVLRSLNQLDNADILSVGQQLLIPKTQP